MAKRGINGEKETDTLLPTLSLVQAEKPPYLSNHKTNSSPLIPPQPTSATVKRRSLSCIPISSCEPLGCSEQQSTSSSIGREAIERRD